GQAGLGADGVAEVDFIAGSLTGVIEEIPRGIGALGGDAHSVLCLGGGAEDQDGCCRKDELLHWYVLSMCSCWSPVARACRQRRSVVIGGVEELFEAARFGSAEHLVRRAFLLDAALMQEDHPVADRAGKFH